MTSLEALYATLDHPVDYWPNTPDEPDYEAIAEAGTYDTDTLDGPYHGGTEYEPDYAAIVEAGTYDPDRFYMSPWNA